MQQHKGSPNPVGVQFAIPIFLQGGTRMSSSAAFSWLGANIEPNVDSTTSNALLGNPISSASPSRNATGTLGGGSNTPDLE